MIACIVSKSQEDNKPSENPDVATMRAELEAQYADDEPRRPSKSGSKAYGVEPSFLIVCDKLLTGSTPPSSTSCISTSR